MSKLTTGWRLATLALAMALAGGSSGCLGALLLKKAADTRIVDTGVENPEGMETFFRGAKRLGCRNEQSSSGDWWTVCKGSTFGLDQDKIQFGFEEKAKNLTVGCDKKDQKHCDDPINKILDAGRQGA